MHDTTQRRAVSDRDLQAGGQDPATTTQTAYCVQRAVRRKVKALPAQLATETPARARAGKEVVSA